jgi:tetratricopeptide (TPR) repeat protein
MKKTVISFLLSGVLFISGIKAQSIQEGMNHLYADRFKSAEAVFQKLLATNPNNIEAIYWLGQVYFDMDDNVKARQLYEKALQTNGNAPLLLAGLGHADLLDKKTNEARQKFEQAITASRGKKGDDPVVLTAIGRANVDAKAGDLAYALEKLKSAAEKDPRNTETLLQLGNAHRKARPGEGGGEAYLNYKKALEVNPAFAVASIRLAKIFESQKNWDLVSQYLNDAVTRDPKFTLGYYELFYYYFLRQKYPEAEEQLKKFIDSKLPEKDIQDEYLYGQLCYVRKDYDCAIQKGETVVSQLGDKTKPRIYKLLAYAYLDKGTDYATALKYANLYFAREKPEDLISQDYKMKANILAKTGGTPQDVYTTFIKGVALDTVLADKIEFLTQGAEFFKTLGDSTSRNLEGDLRMEIIKIKPNAGQRNYFDAGLAYYQGKNYQKSLEVFNTYTQKWPEETFGWQWLFNNNRAMDTTMEKGLAVDPAMKYLEVLEKDTVKYKTSIISTAGYLAQYYANVAKDKDKALLYLEKMLAMDPSNDTIRKYIEDMKKPPKPTKPATTQKSNKTSSTKVTSKSKTTVKH